MKCMNYVVALYLDYCKWEYHGPKKSTVHCVTSFLWVEVYFVLVTAKPMKHDTDMYKKGVQASEC